ncbi:MAG: nucleotidyltransferase domain-containing protein [Gemmatimonadetes bacterium]|jgi:predicted nucleotidyltransferase|nr:nucleotidyltransferase domain-containing protein [Gemmatimonadota bacterium]
MARTALDLSREEWKAYKPRSASTGEESARWEQAHQVACQAAVLLRDQFGAVRVVAFGSLSQRDSFTLWSDIDIAAWGIPDRYFFRAVAAVTGMSADFSIDLVDVASCRPVLRQRIEAEGMEL